MKRALALGWALACCGVAGSAGSAAPPAPRVVDLANATRHERIPWHQLEWPESPSAFPRPMEWTQGRWVELPRRSGVHAGGCRVEQLREWLRVRCEGMRVSGITQLGGAPGARYAIEPAGDDRIPGGGEIVVPVRRGDRRVFLLWTFDEGYDGPLTVVPGVVMQEYWLAGAAAPVVVLTDALHEPVRTARSSR